MTGRLLTVRDVCRLLRRTAAWFYAHRAELEAEGFPRPVPVVGHYDERAIAAWFDSQAGQTEESQVKEKIRGRFSQWGKSA